MSTSGYTQEGLEEAIRLVKSKKMSLNAARKVYNIPLTTLADKVTGRRPVKPYFKSLLTPVEEEELVKWILVCSARSMGRSHQDVREKVREIVLLRGDDGKRGDGYPGKDWIAAFKKRHPEIGLSLRLRTPQSSLGKERALVPAESVTSWLGQMKEFLDARDPSLITSPDRLFNVAETGFSLAVTSSNRVYRPSSNIKQIFTILSCSAVGLYVSPTILFVGKRLPSYNPLEGFDKALFLITGNGRLNSSSFNAWIRDVFVPSVEHVKKPVVLFVSNLASLYPDMGTTELCDENGIILYSLLASASHILQPLDLTVFPEMKSAWQMVTTKHLEETGETPSKVNFARLLKKVWDDTTKPEFAVNGFVKAGIFPFNPLSPLSSGQTEASTARLFSVPTTTPTTISSCPEIVPTAPCQPTPSSSTFTPSMTPSFDALTALINISHKIGHAKSIKFLTLTKSGKTSRDREFSHFHTIISELSAPHSMSSAPIPVPPRPHPQPSLKTIVPAPALPKAQREKEEKQALMRERKKMKEEMERKKREKKLKAYRKKLDKMLKEIEKAKLEINVDDDDDGGETSEDDEGAVVMVSESDDGEDEME